MFVPLLFFQVEKKVIFNLIFQRSLSKISFKESSMMCLKAIIFIMSNYHCYYSDMLDQKELS